jgi:putative ABC transport system permease protein
MFSTRWQKVVIDLWRNRTRTAIVALAIAVGVYAVGVVLNVGELVVREYRRDQVDARFAAAVVRTEEFGDDLAERVAEIPGVAAAEGRRTVETRYYGEEGIPRDLVLTAIPSFAVMEVDAVELLDGRWPTEKREILLERLSLEYLGLKDGDTLLVELDNGSTKLLTVVGVVHDAQELSPSITSRASGYVTPETMDSLGYAETYSELRLRVDTEPQNETHINEVVDEVEEFLNDTGRPVYTRQVITESRADPFINTIVLILSSIGLLILFLSGFLVINAISALITQQIPQIGVMKLIGARRWQIMSLYIVTVLVYGLLAVGLGLPLAVVTGRLLMDTLVQGLLNVLPDSYQLPLPLIAAQIAVGLLLPLLAGLVPVLKGTRITTQKALNDVGMDAGVDGHGWVERALGGVQRLFTLRRPILLAIRNTMRHKTRLAQTLIVLVVGTALFVSVLSVRTSVDATVDAFMRMHQYDVSVELERPYRLARLEELARQVPGVAAVEGWSLGGALRIRPDGAESDRMRVYGVPVETDFMDPDVTSGRWLGPGRNEVIVNSDVLDKETDVRVGEPIVLKLDGREEMWTVVGVVPTESRGPSIYVKAEDLGYATRTPGQATHLQVSTVRHDAVSQSEIERRLLQHLEAEGIEVRSTETTQVMREENKLMFTIVVAFLILMALLLAAVGGLGLTTTMSINILERVREVGVLRAIGASNLTVGKIVLVEGMAIGLLSWFLGLVLSWPISAFMSEQLGLALIKIPLSFQYSTGAAIVWFFALQAVALVASLGPARKAVRLTIREVLAYE